MTSYLDAIAMEISTLACLLVPVPRFMEGSYVLFNTSRQMRPSLSTLGWKILVRKRILGGVIG